jgi:hypothetical protein
VEVLEQYVEEIRPLYGMDDYPALFVTERGGRIVRRTRLFDNLAEHIELQRTRILEGEDGATDMHYRVAR